MPHWTYFVIVSCRSTLHQCCRRKFKTMWLFSLNRIGRSRLRSDARRLQVWACVHLWFQFECLTFFWREQVCGTLFAKYMHQCDVLVDIFSHIILTRWHQGYQGGIDTWPWPSTSLHIRVHHIKFARKSVYRWILHTVYNVGFYWNNICIVEGPENDLVLQEGVILDTPVIKWMV